MATKLREVVNFPIHQATHTNDLFKVLGGRKDDVFVYDRYNGGFCLQSCFSVPLKLRDRLLSQAKIKQLRRHVP